MAITRRSLTTGLAAAGLGTALPGALAADIPQIKWATFTPGFIPAFMNCTVARGFDRANGVALSPPIPYSSLTSYFGDFVAGAFDVSFGGWDGFALYNIRGVPVRFICGINPGDLLNIVTLNANFSKIEDLRGKVVAATTTSGTYRLVKSIIHALTGFDLEKEAIIQTVDHPLAGVTLVLADRADAALTWEPSVTIGASKNPKLRVLLNVGELYRQHEKADMPYLGFAVRQEALDRHPGLAGKLAAAFSATVTAMNAEPRATYAAAESLTGLPADTLVRAGESGRLVYRFTSMAEPAGRRALERCSEILASERNLPRTLDANFFAV